MGIKIKKCPKCGENEWTPGTSKVHVCKECAYVLDLNKPKAVILTNAIETFESKRVAVCVSSRPMDRNGFHAQISVTGTLERHPGRDSYRVLVSDGNYVYFEKPNVHSIVTAEDWATRDGAVAVVFLKPKAFYGE